MVRLSRVAWRAGIGSRIAVLAGLCLSGCVGSGSMIPPGRVGRDAGPPDLPPASVAAAPQQSAAGSTIGTGPVRVALIIPLSGQGQGAAAAQSMRNAAELALGETPNAEISLMVKDDRGTPEGAREAASEAIGEGAELIIGPLFAGSVRAAGQVARQAGKPVIAFSTDTTVAARGIYLLSFLVQAEVDRIITYAASQGRRSVAALVPETTYGSVAEAQFREAAARQGLRVVAIERYAEGQSQAAIQRLRAVIGGSAPQADSLFVPENADGLRAVAQNLQAVAFDPQKVKLLGTGLWNEPRLFDVAILDGAWFSAPDNRGFNAFAARYRGRFNSDPIRLATLSYDAVTLAAALTRVQGSQRFTDGVLTNPAGFAGADGVFRFKADGTNERALSVQEIHTGATATISPAPRSLSGN
ncbi:penicillin-binding protein activator [Microvirga antarctica]|uniref:penicillin-binding protein activator n=1 Tax=Microvirga antarctica TaxID=2819233 RepID=UPI001FE9AE30|nr:penicillin-binding protein activator [Microvirga antarctica]